MALKPIVTKSGHIGKGPRESTNNGGRRCVSASLDEAAAAAAAAVEVWAYV